MSSSIEFAPRNIQSMNPKAIPRCCYPEGFAVSRFRFDHNVPFREQRIAFEPVLEFLECFLGDLGTRLEYFFENPHDWGNPFPGHRFGPGDGGRAVDQQRPVPVIFQDAPHAFHRVVLAVIRGIVNQVNLKLAVIGKFGGPLDELCWVARQFGAVVQVDNQKRECGRVTLSAPPTRAPDTRQ